MQAIFQQFLQREASPFIQFVKYGIAGCLAVVTHMLVFYFLSWKVIPALESTDKIVVIFGLSVPAGIDHSTRALRAIINNGVAFMISNLVAYLVNKAWVFHPGRHHWALEVALFYLVSGISFGIGEAMMWVQIRFLHWSTTFSFVTVVIVSAMINYSMRKFCIFAR